MRGIPTIRQFEPVIWVIFGLAVALLTAPWTRIAIPMGIPKVFTLASPTEAVGVAVSVKK